MALVISEAAEHNKKPRSKWKDRFIYTMLGLFAGMFGIHNFYIGRKVVGFIQIIFAAAWITLLAKLWNNVFEITSFQADMTALAIFIAEIIWVDLEVFLIRREKDSDIMNDEARPARILLGVIVILMYQFFPLGLVVKNYIDENPNKEISAGKLVETTKLEDRQP